MRLFRPLGILVLVLSALAPCFASDTSTNEKIFTIAVAPPTLPKDVQVRYFLSGEFGGFFASTTATGQDNKIVIRTDHDSKSATSFHAIAYAPGCEFVTISVDDLTTSNREAEFQCQRLSTTLFQGRIPTSQLQGKDLQVEVLYVCNWAAKFLGFGNGAISPLVVTRVPVETDGTFAIELPDFAADPLWSSGGSNAALTFHLVDASTGKALNTLVPPKDIANGISINVASSYPPEVAFGIQP
jgi:hypothetical protein